MGTRENEIVRLGRQLRRTQIAVGLLLIVSIGVLVDKSAAPRGRADTVLRVRGLIIEDEQGNPRVLLGAPTPSVAGRRRQEPINGIVLLGPNGADRVVVSYPGYEPQVMGKVQKRSMAMPSAGLMINDADGNERVGLGASDDGSRIALGMDYADRDALGLLVSPNFSGLVAFARNGERNDQATIAVLKDGTSTFKLADTNGDEGIIVEDRKGAPLKVQVQNPATHKLQEIAPPLAH